MKMLLVCLFLSWSPLRAMAADSGGSVYIVPASPDGTHPAMNYSLTDFNVTMPAPGTISVSFSLPDDLIGPDQPPVVLTGAVAADGRSAQLLGAGVSALCLRSSADQSDCSLTFTQGYTQPDVKSVEAYLAKKYANASEAVRDSKIMDSAMFIRDPEGRLLFHGW